MIKRTLALTAAGSLLAAPVALLVATPAQADTERSGVCGSGRYELSVDREGRGFEVNADLDDVKPGSRWTITLRQDGKVVANVTRTADREGDLDVERFRPDTAGSDTFTMRAKRVGAPTACSTSITVR